MISSFLNFSIVVLFITNLWTFLYLASVDFAYFVFHPVIKDLGFNNPAPNPDPFKLYLYLIYTFIFVLLIIGTNFLIKKFDLKEKLLPERLLSKYNKLITLVRVTIFLFLLAMFISRLGSFPLSKSPGHFSLNGYISPYPEPNPDLTIFILVVYIGFLAFLTFQSSILTKIVLEKRILLFCSYLVALILVFVVTFDANFTIPTLDAAFFYGPVWEVTHGKTILTDVISQYGFLSILLFSAIHTLTGINYVYLPVTILILFLVEYGICFHLVHKTSKSVTLAFLCLFSLITINYFGIFHNPQFGPLRWVPHFIVLFLFSRFKKIDAKILIFSVALLSLWNIDSGIALLLAYVSSLGFLFLTGKLNFKRIILSGVYLCISFFLIFAFLEIINLLIQQRLINIFELYAPIFHVSEGFAIRQLQTTTYFWILMLTYFASIIYFLKNTSTNEFIWSGKNDFKKVGAASDAGGKPLTSLPAGKAESAKKINLDQLLLLSANMLFFAGIYFVGESLPHNVVNLSPFIILTFFLLIGLHFRKHPATNYHLLITVLIFIIFIIYPAFMKKEFLVSEITRKIQDIRKGKIFSSELDKLVKERYSGESLHINKNLTDNPVIIVSPDDTYLFYLTGKSNLFNINPSTYINSKNQMQLALRNLEPDCPKKIAIDCQVAGKCPTFETITHAAIDIQRLILDSIEKKCNLKYTPTNCTDKICIGEAKHE